MRKGTPLERAFVWVVGILSYGLAFVWIDSQIPPTNNSILLQWGCVAFGAVFGVIGLVVGYLAVTYRRR